MSGRKIILVFKLLEADVKKLTNLQTYKLIKMRILVINPGSTSTKVAVYDNEKQLWSENVYHSAEELSRFSHVNEQHDFRKELIIKTLHAAGFSLQFDAVIGRGGLLKPTQGGVYLVNEKIKYDLLNSRMEHASNLGAIIADEIAKGCDCPAYIADPVVTDEMCDLARVTGMPEISRISIFHALNSRAVSRKYAASIGRKYDDLNLIVVHLGGGISIGAHSKGRVVDVNNALDGDGPFSPERSGSIPTRQLVDLCFSGKYSYDDIRKMINGHGGLYAHLGTTDARSIVAEIKSGNRHAYNVLHAMAYNIAKSIGSMHVVLKQKTDAIIMTGGMANNDYVVKEILSWIEGLAPIVIVPGEDEMGALAMNALGALNGELELQEYNPK